MYIPLLSPLGNAQNFPGLPSMSLNLFQARGHWLASSIGDWNRMINMLLIVGNNMMKIRNKRKNSKQNPRCVLTLLSRIFPQHSIILSIIQ
jgi:hypothetical protein